MKKTLLTILLCSGAMATVLPMSAMPTNPTEAPVAEKSRNVIARMELPAFSGIYCDVVAHITIEQGNEYLIEAQGPEHIIQLIEPEVHREGGTLTIKSAKEYKVERNNGITIRIVTPTIDMVYNDGVCNMHVKGNVKTSMMTVTNEGVGNVTIDNLQCEILQVINEGVGNINITGQATQRAVFKTEGVGSINAGNLVTPELTAELCGVGSIECHATERLTCKANGVGNIYYAGDPKQTNISNNSIGKVKKR